MLDNLFEIGDFIGDSINSYKYSGYTRWYNPKTHKLELLSNGVSHDGLIKFCSLDGYKFTEEFLKRHNLSNKFLAKLEKAFQNKDIEAFQAEVLFEDDCISVPKITKKIGAFSIDEKEETVAEKGEVYIGDMLEREYNREALKVAMHWCIKNNIPFISTPNLLYIQDAKNSEAVISLFSCDLLKRGDKNLYCKLKCENAFYSNNICFDIIELQRKTLSGWVAYNSFKEENCYSDCIETYRSDYAFFDLPNGEYRMKIYFITTVTTGDMMLCVQEGLFYSNEVEVN